MSIEIINGDCINHMTIVYVKVSQIKLKNEK